MKQESNAQKNPIKDQAISLLIESVKTVFVASGKKILEYEVNDKNLEEILSKITGRSGALRAPTLKRGSALYVGFNSDLYAQLVTS